MMSSHVAISRKENLNQLHFILAYLKKYHKTELVFDPRDPTLDARDFEQRYWMSNEIDHFLKERTEILDRMT